MDGYDNNIGDTIDPEVVVDEKERVWMFFGSSYGIHRVRLANDGLHLSKKHRYEHVAGLTILQSRDRSHVYEGAYLYYHGGYWYLFVSSGHYNKGDYRILCGRSRRLDGVFYDKDGKRMTDGHASVVLYSDNEDDLFGPGHNGEIFSANDGKTFMFYHCHSKKIPSKNNRTYIPRPLFLQEVRWDKDGWPYMEGLKPLEQIIKPY